MLYRSGVRVLPVYSRDAQRRGKGLAATDARKGDGAAELKHSNEAVFGQSRLTEMLGRKYKPRFPTLTFGVPPGTICLLLLVLPSIALTA